MRKGVVCGDCHIVLPGVSLNISEYSSEGFSHDFNYTGLSSVTRVSFFVISDKAYGFSRIQECQEEREDCITCLWWISLPCMCETKVRKNRTYHCPRRAIQNLSTMKTRWSRNSSSYFLSIYPELFELSWLRNRKSWRRFLLRSQRSPKSQTHNFYYCKIPYNSKFSTVRVVSFQYRNYGVMQR